MERRSSVLDRLDHVLGSLPEDVGTASHGRQRLVVSTGGVFVLDPMGPGAGTTPVEASALAVTTRDRLAEKLRWVPFVDWFVVTEGDSTSSQIPVDLVANTILEGHCVDEATVRRICALLEFGELSPPWEFGRAAPLVTDRITGSRNGSDSPIV